MGAVQVAAGRGRAVGICGVSLPTACGDVPQRINQADCAACRLQSFGASVVDGHDAMEQWMDGIAKLSNNLGATNPAAYMRNATVFQLGRGATPRSVNSDGERNAVLAEYEFIDIFPTNISQIDLSYDSSDTIEEFTVEFQVQSFNLNEAGGPDD